MERSHTEAIRSFNRFYTGIIGLLDEYILNSTYTLPEARILFELNRKGVQTASEIIATLHIDKGYLSRILRKFDKKKLLVKERSSADGRSVRLRLSPAGQEAFEELNQRSRQHIGRLLTQVADEERDALLFHMAEIRRIFSDHLHLNTEADASDY